MGKVSSRHVTMKFQCVTYTWCNDHYRLRAVQGYDVSHPVECCLTVQSIRHQQHANRKFLERARGFPFLVLEHPTGTCAFCIDGTVCRLQPSCCPVKYHVEPSESGPAMVMFQHWSDLWYFRRGAKGCVSLEGVESVHSHTMCVPETISRPEVARLCRDREISMQKQIRDCRIVVVSAGGVVSYGLHSFRRMGGKGVAL